MYLVKTPVLISKLSSRSLVWNIPNNEKKIYLTFDDGPIPELTMEILVYLNEYQAKATFFCVGENAKKYPELIDRIKDDGHLIGNHSYHHINGWKNNTTSYLESIEKASQYIKSNLFRPPYGKITYSQIKQVKKNYKIIMWSVLSGDFDQNISSEQCFKNVQQCKSGDIIVFHDNIKAQKKIHDVIPRFLEHYSRLGYEFCAIE